MLIELSAYGNRWRRVAPSAKGLFALCGISAAFVAATPAAAGGVALILSAVTVLGAGIPPGRYLRVAAPGLLFLALSTLSLALSLTIGAGAGDLSLHWAPRSEWPGVAQVCGRSLGALAALLFLALTTPLTDLIALLRRLGAPEVLLDLMTLCYRTLFVLAVAVRETLTAQAARLGHATLPLSLRSLGVLTAGLAAQVWERSRALHLAALARNGDGPLRFLDERRAGAAREMAVAAGGGTALIVLARVIP